MTISEPARLAHTALASLAIALSVQWGSMGRGTAQDTETGDGARNPARGAETGDGARNPARDAETGDGARTSQRAGDPQPTDSALGPTESAPPMKKGSYTKWKLPAAGESRSGDPEIILTFDDGPHERYSKMVLDELAKRDLKAIFFWVGRRITGTSPHLERRRELVRRAVREGHIVAPHGVEHLHLCAVPKRRAETEIDRGVALLDELSGLPMVFFRTPYGNHCKRLVRMLDERGLTHLHWDIDPMEWTDHDSARVAATLNHKLRRLRGRAVVLMHDSQLATARALPKALDFIAAENQRRRERGRRPIRILTGSDLARERLDPALATVVHESAASARDRIQRALARLIP